MQIDKFYARWHGQVVNLGRTRNGKWQTALKYAASGMVLRMPPAWTTLLLALPPRHQLSAAQRPTPGDAAAPLTPLRLRRRFGYQSARVVRK